jgi:hypothetical protein
VKAEGDLPRTFFDVAAVIRNAGLRANPFDLPQITAHSAAQEGCICASLAAGVRRPKHLVARYLAYITGQD